MNNILDEYQSQFATYKATLLQNNDRYLVIDWCSTINDDYINYIFDKKHSKLNINSSFGDCIASWCKSLDVPTLKSCISNIAQFTQKITCATDMYSYSPQNVLNDIQNTIVQKSIDVLNIIETNSVWCDSLDDFWNTIKTEVYKSRCTDVFLPTDTLVKIIQELDVDYYKWLYNCGKRIDDKIYLWSFGFQIACEQLSL